uniref:Uncharacterized protein n=1 Tax=Schlesneria paludicola TaxID=360056 RepID=A0A7C4LPC3_9PLAN
MQPPANAPVTANVTFRLREFNVPLVRDAIVLGRRAKVGCVAMRKALMLLHDESFEHLELDDEVVNDVLVRTAVLKRIPLDNLIHMVLKCVKPWMSDDEILSLQIDVELTVSATN